MHINRTISLILLLTTLAGSFTAGSSAVGAVGAPDKGRGRAHGGPEWDAPQAAEQLLVKLPQRGRAALAGTGAQILREIPELGLALVRPPRGLAMAEAAADLQRAGVEWAEPNYIFALDYTPNDPLYPSKQTPYLRRIDAEGAWGLAQGRPDIVIAVLDTGVDMNHEDLRDGIWTNPGEIPGNSIDDEGNGFVDDVHGWDFADDDNDPSDDHHHGTHVAGIAAARVDNGVGIAGVAGRATIMPVDVFAGGIGTYEDLIRAIVYAADNGARVINMSLGASSYSLGEEAAVNYANQKGVVVVAAAGNTGSSARPEQYHYPAAHANAIAVASTQADDNLSYFSTRGEWVDVAAPGSSIYSTYPGNEYAYLSGTSMATPHVSGLAALILSRNPALTPQQVRTAIESTADDLAPAGRDIYFGAGRINAARALAAVEPNQQPLPTPAPGPGTDLDLPGCQELVANGGFEDGSNGWQSSGSVGIDPFVRADGIASAYFPGWPADVEVMTQTVTIPAAATEAVVKFAYRIDPADNGRGASPEWPFDDWFTVDWRSAEGKSLGQLLRTGNTADTVSAGLQWDQYLYRLEKRDLDALRSEGPVAMVFTSQNDGDAAQTKVWVDNVRFCARVTPRPSYPVRARLPMIHAGY